jgi:hypothetical protein
MVGLLKKSNETVHLGLVLFERLNIIISPQPQGHLRYAHFLKPGPPTTSTWFLGSLSLEGWSDTICDKKSGVSENPSFINMAKRILFNVFILNPI